MRSSSEQMTTLPDDPRTRRCTDGNGLPPLELVDVPDGAGVHDDELGGEVAHEEPRGAGDLLRVEGRATAGPCSAASAAALSSRICWYRAGGGGPAGGWGCTRAPPTRGPSGGKQPCATRPMLRFFGGISKARHAEGPNELRLRPV